MNSLSSVLLPLALWFPACLFVFPCLPGLKHLIPCNAIYVRIPPISSNPAPLPHHVHLRNPLNPSHPSTPQNSKGYHSSQHHHQRNAAPHEDFTQTHYSNISSFVPSERTSTPILSLFDPHEHPEFSDRSVAFDKDSDLLIGNAGYRYGECECERQHDSGGADAGQS
jgi:hypothetical protein